MELLQPYYSGNALEIIKGIGIINCLHFNFVTGLYWIVYCQIFHSDGSSKNELDHAEERFT